VIIRKPIREGDLVRRYRFKINDVGIGIVLDRREEVSNGKWSTDWAPMKVAICMWPDGTITDEPVSKLENLSGQINIT
jgi:hypothetical protein